MRKNVQNQPEIPNILLCTIYYYLAQQGSQEGSFWACRDNLSLGIYIFCASFRFAGHNKDILSVVSSADRPRSTTIKLSRKQSQQLSSPLLNKETSLTEEQGGWCVHIKSSLSSTTCSSALRPTLRSTRQAVHVWPFSKIASTSSSVRPAVSGNMKKMWMNAAMLKAPNMK